MSALQGGFLQAAFGHWLPSAWPKKRRTRMTDHRRRTDPLPPTILVQAWTKAMLAVIAMLAASASLAQSSDTAGSGALTASPAQVRVDFVRIRMPGDEHMGLVGTSYLIDIGGGFAIGPAGYGAVTGQRGGLLVGGAEAAWHHRLSGPLELEVGMYAGGGGGGAAPVGGGLMLRPHADLLWNFGPYKLGVSASQVRFANGQINSRQLGLVWSASTEFRYVERDRIGGMAPAISGRSGMGFDRIQTVLGIYKPRGGSKLKRTGAPLTQKIGFVGTRFERAIDDHWYWGLEAGGAGSGGVGGYDEYLGAIGYETTVLRNSLTLGARASLGTGGGGDVAVGGGLLLKGGVYGTVRMARNLGLSLEAGFARTREGGFNALTGLASLAWILDDPNDVSAPPRVTRTEWVAGVSHQNTQRRDGSVRDTQFNVLKGNRFVTQSVYLTGQAHSAWGGQAGGYITGMFGIGFQAPLFGRFHAGAEALVGAGGGGGVDSQGGALVQPMAYVGFDINRSLALRIGGGRVKAVKGGLNSNVIEATLAFNFGVAERGYR